MGRSKRRRFGSIIVENGLVRIRWTTPDGSRKLKTIGRATSEGLRIAEQQLNSIELAIARGDLLGQGELQPIRFDEFSEMYMRNARARQEPTTFSRSEQRMRRLVEFFGRQKVHEISVSHVVKFSHSLYRSGIVHATVNRYLSLLSVTIEEAKKLGHAKHNPARELKREREKKREFEWLEVHEQRRLIESMPTVIRDAVAILLDTGLRMGELNRLRVSDVRWGDAEVVIRTAKPRRGRVLPLTKRALDALARVRALRGADGEVRPLKTYKSFLRNWNKGLKVSGLSFRLTPHGLRHLYATNPIRAGVSIPDVARLLGATFETAARYADHAPGNFKMHARNALEKLQEEEGREASKGG